VQWAKKKFPLTHRVRVYLRQNCPDDHLGYYLYDDKKDTGVIVVRATTNRDQLIDTFVEEWAHARTVHLEDPEADDPYHTATFWSEYGRIAHASRQQAW
jgi:hypothetical protein